MMIDVPAILLVEDNPNDVELTLEASTSTNWPTSVTSPRRRRGDGVPVGARGRSSARLPGDPRRDPARHQDAASKDGLEVLREIRGDPALELLPVVVLTSSREEQDLIASYELGVNTYVVKPVDFGSSSTRSSSWACSGR